ncbi:MAG: hypothetical protein AB7U35_01535, partial [Sphingobium sp.]
GKSASVHNRMPVILAIGDHASSLGGTCPTPLIFAGREREKSSSIAPIFYGHGINEIAYCAVRSVPA